MAKANGKVAKGQQVATIYKVEPGKLMKQTGAKGTMIPALPEVNRLCDVISDCLSEFAKKKGLGREPKAEELFDTLPTKQPALSAALKAVMAKLSAVLAGGYPMALEGGEENPAFKYLSGMIANPARFKAFHDDGKTPYEGLQTFIDYGFDLPEEGAAQPSL